MNVAIILTGRVSREQRVVRGWAPRRWAAACSSRVVRNPLMSARNAKVDGWKKTNSPFHRPKMEKSHLKRHELLFWWIFSGVVQQKQGSLTYLCVKRGVRGVSSAMCPFLGGREASERGVCRQLLRFKLPSADGSSGPKLGWAGSEWCWGDDLGSFACVQLVAVERGSDALVVVRVEICVRFEGQIQPWKKESFVVILFQSLVCVAAVSGGLAAWRLIEPKAKADTNGLISASIEIGVVRYLAHVDASWRMCVYGKATITRPTWHDCDFFLPRLFAIQSRWHDSLIPKIATILLWSDLEMSLLIQT